MSGTRIKEHVDPEPRAREIGWPVPFLSSLHPQLYACYQFTATQPA